MKALTIRQPWASLIFEGKDLENRVWTTTYRGPLLIHAGLAHDEEDYMCAYHFTRKPEISLGLSWLMTGEGSTKDWRDWMNDELPRGGIIGIVNVIGCTSDDDSPWFTGPNGLILRDKRPLPFFACKGKLGLFEVDYPPELLAA